MKMNYLNRINQLFKRFSIITSQYFEKKNNLLKYEVFVIENIL